MTGLLDEAASIQARLDAAGFRFCFIGGIALQCWGAPRYTQDLDLQLAVAFGKEADSAARLATAVPPRVEDAVAFASSSRVFLGQTENGTPVDIAFGGTAFEDRILGRSSMQSAFGIRVCSAEDLVVMKAFAGREQDWVDVATIVKRQGERLNWRLVEDELLPLVALRGASQLPSQLNALRRPSP